MAASPRDHTIEPRAELTPGSDAAWNHGCICPVMDNAGGRGVTLSTGVFFWINGACPLHGKRADGAARVHAPDASPCPGMPSLHSPGKADL